MIFFCHLLLSLWLLSVGPELMGRKNQPVSWILCGCLLKVKQKRTAQYKSMAVGFSFLFLKSFHFTHFTSNLLHLPNESQVKGTFFSYFWKQKTKKKSLVAWFSSRLGGVSSPAWRCAAGWQRAPAVGGVQGKTLWLHTSHTSIHHFTQTPPQRPSLHVLLECRLKEGS